jgi:hypothetical protein
MPVRIKKQKRKKPAQQALQRRWLVAPPFLVCLCRCNTIHLGFPLLGRLYLYLSAALIRALALYIFLLYPATNLLVSGLQ